MAEAAILKQHPPKWPTALISISSAVTATVLANLCGLITNPMHRVSASVPGDLFYGSQSLFTGLLAACMFYLSTKTHKSNILLLFILVGSHCAFGIAYVIALLIFHPEYLGKSRQFSISEYLEIHFIFLPIFYNAWIVGAIAGPLFLIVRRSLRMRTIDNR